MLSAEEAVYGRMSGVHQDEASESPSLPKFHLNLARVKDVEIAEKQRLAHAKQAKEVKKGSHLSKLALPKQAHRPRTLDPRVIEEIDPTNYLPKHRKNHNSGQASIQIRIGGSPDVKPAAPKYEAPLSKLLLDPAQYDIAQELKLPPIRLLRFIQINLTVTRSKSALGNGGLSSRSPSPMGRSGARSATSDLDDMVRC